MELKKPVSPCFMNKEQCKDFVANPSCHIGCERLKAYEKDKEAWYEYMAKQNLFWEYKAKRRSQFLRREKEVWKKK